MKIELIFTDEQLKKLEKIAKMKNLDLEEYLKSIVKDKINNTN